MLLKHQMSQNLLKTNMEIKFKLKEVMLLQPLKLKIFGEILMYIDKDQLQLNKLQDGQLIMYNLIFQITEFILLKMLLILSKEMEEFLSKNFCLFQLDQQLKEMINKMKEVKITMKKTNLKMTENKKNTDNLIQKLHKCDALRT